MPCSFLFLASAIYTLHSRRRFCVGDAKTWRSRGSREICARNTWNLAPGNLLFHFVNETDITSGMRCKWRRDAVEVQTPAERVFTRRHASMSIMLVLFTLSLSSPPSPLPPLSLSLSLPLDIRFCFCQPVALLQRRAANTLEQNDRILKF